MREVIIIGGGPAGSTAARVIAESGGEPLVLERCEAGASSQCAGGLGSWWLEELDLDIPEGVICKPIGSVVIHSPDEKVSFTSEDFPKHHTGKPLGYVVDRKKFDIWLQERAEEAGAEVKHGVSFKNHRRENGRVTIETSEGEMEAETLILANGAQPNDPDNHVCYQEIVDLGEREPEVELWFDPDLVPVGYVWAFQESATAYRVGAGVPIRLARNHSPKGMVREFKERMDWGGEVYRRGGGLVGTGKRKVSNHGRVLLAGDRANWASGLSGAGVFPAVRGGATVGNCVAENRLEDLESELRSSLEGWWKVQELGRKATEGLSGRDWDELIKFLKSYDVSSADPTQEVRGIFMKLVSHPLLAFKMMRSIFFNRHKHIS